MSFERITVKIPSATPDWNLDAWKYIPTVTNEGTPRHGPYPVIILAHGLSANKLLALDAYAARYAEEGYASVVFDYRRWGMSDGTPRHILRISEQLEDYRSVISWTQQLPEFDSKRIIIWGTSFSGGHILQLASEQDHDIVAAMCQCPYTGTARSNHGLRGSFAAFGNLVKLVSFAVADVVRQSVGMSPLYCKAASDPGGGGILTVPGALQGYTSLVKDPSHLPNEINASCIFQVSQYNPHSMATSITCPLLLVIPEADNICSTPGALKVASGAQRCEVVRTEGGHFDVYPGHKGFDRAVHAQLEFMRRHVPV
ncbi:alpha/beta-hydrolase [Gautieria morchelliformis]|nr:alpha/beta-hydrolase [Gautieria morchelliformis]